MTLTLAYVVKIITLNDPYSHNFHNYTVVGFDFSREAILTPLPPASGAHNFHNGTIAQSRNPCATIQS